VQPVLQTGASAHHIQALVDLTYAASGVQDHHSDRMDVLQQTNLHSTTSYASADRCNKAMNCQYTSYHRQLMDAWYTAFHLHQFPTAANVEKQAIQSSPEFCEPAASVCETHDEGCEGSEADSTVTVSAGVDMEDAPLEMAGAFDADVTPPQSFATIGLPLVLLACSGHSMHCSIVVVWAQLHGNDPLPEAG
jgi:hypothetical protein